MDAHKASSDLPLQTSLSYLLGAPSCLRLPMAVRQQVNKALLSVKNPNLIYSVLIAGHKLVQFVRPRKTALWAEDLCKYPCPAPNSPLMLASWERRMIKSPKGGDDQKPNTARDDLKPNKARDDQKPNKARDDQKPNKARDDQKLSGRVWACQGAMWLRAGVAPAARHSMALLRFLFIGCIILMLPRVSEMASYIRHSLLMSHPSTLCIDSTFTPVLPSPRSSSPIS
jgi:hypothetical protein